MSTIQVLIEEKSIQVNFSVGEGSFGQEIIGIIDHKGKLHTENSSEKDNILIELLFKKYIELGNVFLDSIDELRS